MTPDVSRSARLGPPTPGLWEVYRCEHAGPDQACGIRANNRGDVHDMVVSDTARDECQHHMRLADAEHIVELHNYMVAPVVHVKGAIPSAQFDEFREKFLAEHGGSNSRPVILDSDLCYVGTRGGRQGIIGKWTVECFGEVEATSIPQRSLRLLEEAVELAQAAGLPLSVVSNLVNFVFARPTGEVEQEVGGVSICLLALCAALGASADDLERREFDRVMSKPSSHFTQRNAAKNEAGFKVTP